MTENEAIKELSYDSTAYGGRCTEEVREVAIQALEKVQVFEAIGTVEELKALKEKNNKDFELLLKAVKESYPMFKGAYVELDVFMGDVMRRFARDKQ